MSKSKKNVILATKFIKKFDADTLRFLFLNSNPTKPINLNKNLIQQSFNQKEKFKNIFIKAQLENKSKINISKIANEFLN
jgi:cysteinyl-tRNA synthetase